MCIFALEQRQQQPWTARFRVNGLALLFHAIGNGIQDQLTRFQLPNI